MPASGCRQPDPDVPGKLDGAEPLRSPKERLCADRKKGGQEDGPSMLQDTSYRTCTYIPGDTFRLVVDRPHYQREVRA